MRYSQGHKQRTYERILTSAGRLFRQRGYRGIGVEAIMKSVGLTHGGFYAHFASKEELFGAVLARTFGQTREWLLQGLDERQRLDWLRGLVQRYLSREHRESVGDGCTMAALISDLPRTQPAPRATFERHFCAFAREVAARMPDEAGMDPHDRALATLALCVGGLSLARAVNDPELANRILIACQQFALPEDWTASDAGPPAARQ